MLNANQPYYYLVNEKGQRWCKHQTQFLDPDSRHTPTKVVAKDRKSLFSHCMYRVLNLQESKENGSRATLMFHTLQGITVRGFQFIPLEKHPFAGYRVEYPRARLSLGKGKFEDKLSWRPCVAFYFDLVAAYDLRFEEV